MTLANATVQGSDPLPSAAQRFVRTEHIPTGYSPWRHMALTLALAGLLATLGAVLAARARPADWLGLPAFWATAMPTTCTCEGSASIPSVRAAAEI